MNKDDALRQKIIGNEKEEYHGGIKRFGYLPLKKFEELVKNDLIDLRDQHNNAPPMDEFYKLLKKYSDEPVWLHGYIVSPEREDYRITVEGIEGNSLNINLLIDFYALLINIAGMTEEGKNERFIKCLSNMYGI